MWNFRQSHCGPVEASSSPQEPEEEHDEDDDVEKEEEPFARMNPSFVEWKGGEGGCKGTKTDEKRAPITSSKVPPEIYTKRVKEMCVMGEWNRSRS